MIDAAKRRVIRGLQRAGYDLVAYDHLTPRWRARADLLAAAAPDLVLDVGANEGQYATDLRAAGWRGRTVSFEPLGAAYALLERAAATDPLWEPQKLALFDEAGDRDLHVAANTASSSLLEMTELHAEAAPYAAMVGVEQVSAERADAVVQRLAPDAGRIWLKLDAQGSELAVLRGAEGILDRVVAVDCELSLDTLYAGQPDIMEIVGWLNERGLLLRTLEEGFAHGSTGQLLQVDGLFARR